MRNTIKRVTARMKAKRQALHDMSVDFKIKQDKLGDVWNYAPYRLDTPETTLLNRAVLP